MEYLQLFDDDKNMLNKKIARSEKLNVEQGQYFMIILVFIENNEHKFLIQKTSQNKKSEYATTGGHVIYGDNSMGTVIKEVKEKLGFHLNENELEFVDSIKYPKAYCDIYYVHANLELENLKLQNEEVTNVNWYTIEEIESLINNEKFRKGNITPFRKVLTYINDKKAL